jgi:hypothetical protein
MKHTLNVELEKQYGGISLRIQLTSERVVESEKGIPEFESMVSNAVEYFKFFEETKLPSLGNFTHKGLSIQTRVFKALDIRVTMDKGKRYYKVATPEHQEFGIPFWPEHMKECGINPKDIPDEGHKCKEGTNAIIEMVDGKPKRVLKLIRE